MSYKVLELHHHAVTMHVDAVEEMGKFYKDILGLDIDAGRWHIPGVPGYFLDLGNDTQLHLLGKDGPSRYADGAPDRDPVSNHVALAVDDIVAAEKELTRQGIDFWRLDNVASPALKQLFFRDPAGNVIEYHQIGLCRCKKSDREFSDKKVAELKAKAAGS